ncbi:ABC transporter related protein [Lacticaseibacillus saniviri JCM 17471 = DSM 24301]|uniref:ABC transporter related protein n=2 Tax=Lacticaseibacillus saniviri TaxID=931533 RepID=A0A0R2MN95_9LACO|nr:ABC transporter related protein [Lacticaseibacillus saniviri JCM 17471 = DSM 24301]
MGMAFLELDGIHKSYYLGKEEFPVLKGISLDFERGEFVSILGESGGGKSTLMNIIGGLDRQFTGQVKIDGKVLDHSKEKEMDAYRRGTIGYIYQSYNLISHLSVLDNVLISLDMTTLNREERKQRAIDLLNQVGLGDQMKKHPNKLSGGQKQRVAIARALASDPKIIIADEPTGALDSQNTKEVLELLDGIAAQGKLVIAVTHSQEVADYGTRIVHLADGVIDNETRLKDAYPVQEDQGLAPRKMPAQATFRNAYSHLTYNFWRNSLIMLGTGIGLFAVLLFSGLGNGVNAFIQDQINSLVNPHSINVMKVDSTKKLGSAAAQAKMAQMANDPTKMAISDKQLASLEHLKGVDAVEPGYAFAGFTATYNGKHSNGNGLKTWTKAYTDNSVTYGKAPTGNGDTILISKNVAVGLMGTKDWKQAIGKTIKISMPWLSKAGQPVQAIRDVKVVGISDSGQTSVTVMSYSSAKKMLESVKADTSPTFVSVNAKSLDNVKSIAKKINNIKVNGRYAFLGITVGDLLDTVQQYVGLASTALSAIAGVSLIVSALMIIVTMYMSVSERTKEIGILRALGQSKGDIRLLFTSESILIGLFSLVPAFVLAYGIGALLNSALSSIVSFNFIQITGGNILTTIVLAILISFLAALLPANRASKMNPIDALSAD